MRKDGGLLNKKVPLGATLALIMITIALTVSVTMVIAMRQFNSTMSDVGQRQVMFEYITDIDKTVRQHYAGTIDEEKLRAALTKGYVEGIGDPYAAYFTAAEYQKENDRMAGTHSGLGLELALTSQGQIRISRVHAESSAERAGVQKGDVLTAVDGEAVSAEGYETLKNRLESASRVILTIQREDQSIAFELSPSPYQTDSVEGRLIGSTGYIRITEFHSLTADQFKAVYDDLSAQGAQNYVFDLRGNPGGMLSSVTPLLEYLMPRGVYARKTDNTGTVTDLIDTDNYQMDLPSVTLVDSDTAGEAELFAGVLQEFGKTTVIGEQTSGRGLTQEYFTISSDGAAVKLSTCQMSLVTGGSFDGTGITPQTVVGLTEEQKANFAFLEDSGDPQLQAALSALESMSAQAG